MDEVDRGHHTISRRGFLRLAGMTAASAAVSACCPKPLVRHEASGKRETGKFGINIGDQEKVSLPGLQWVPDGHVSMIRQSKSNLKVWVSAGPSSYSLEGETFDSLGAPQFALGPEKTQTEKGYQGYASLHSVIPGQKAGELIGFYHQEHWPNSGTYFPFNASIGVVRSTDEGKTWGKRQTIIAGKNPTAFPGERPAVSGAGQPSAVIIKDHVYLYHVDWNGKELDAIHLAKAPLGSVENPSAWQKWTGDGFGKPGDEAVSSPVMTPPSYRLDTVYAALPGVSYNAHLKKYLMVYETNIGFYLSASRDAIQWEESRLIFEFPQPHARREAGDVWYSYPTLLSPAADSDRETEKTGILCCSRGVWQKEPHFMYRLPFELD